MTWLSIRWRLQDGETKKKNDAKFSGMRTEMHGVSITRVGNQEEEVGVGAEGRGTELRHGESEIQVKWSVSPCRTYAKQILVHEDKQQISL